MPAKEKVYPEWVQVYRTRGNTVKKKGDSYYLYKRTSKRIPGKKYPQPVDTYIGVITPEGVVESDRKQIDVTDISVREFGFSRVILPEKNAAKAKKFAKMKIQNVANVAEALRVIG